MRRTAVRLLSRREYSAHELRNRLTSGSTWARRKSGYQSKTARAGPATDVLSDDAAADTADVSSTSGLVPSGSSELAALQPTEDRAPTRAEVEMIIDEMQTLDLQSDQRFAESLVRRRAERQGVSQVARLLRNHQIDPAISDALLDQLRRSELERARHIWSRRFGRIATDLREKSRQSRFLSNRGFSPDVISRVLRGDPSGDTGHLE